MRFLADMGVSPRCVEWLRAMGHDAVHLYEQKLHKLSDHDVLCKAMDEERILLTMDLDFARLVSAAGVANLPIVIIFRLSNQRPLNVQKRLLVVIDVMKSLMLQENAVISVSDERVRIRRLPIKLFATHI